MQNEQDPKLTVAWAMHSLELALRNLEDGPAERRVRRQFHQLMLAVERQSTLGGDPIPAEDIRDVLSGAE